jgi:pimeloyl-ACP methyl ester carboxylesterase
MKSQTPMEQTGIERFTVSGVRLRCRVTRPGALNWLLLPGGPGIGSESLQELADSLDVPGAIWMADLPGASSDLFEKWPQVLIEAAQELPNSVYVGHSTGGMYLLATPELEAHLAGLVLISTAPDASWLPAFVAMTERHPLLKVAAATERFEAEPTNERLRDIAVASAEWNFPARNVARGREFLGRMPYNRDAVAWSDDNFDKTYVHTWWPHSLPTLILSGDEDRIVTQDLWNAPQFQGENILRRTVENAAHFPWLDNPEAVAAAFQELAATLKASRKEEKEDREH